MILSMNRLADWVTENAIEGKDHPEVVRFAKELLIQAEFGHFEIDDEELNGFDEGY